MLSDNAIFTFLVFCFTLLLILWRPFGINEAIPTVIGALLIYFNGIVSLTDIHRIFEIVMGASITIISTIIMSIVLGSFGFFRWAAMNLVVKANGCGIKLYWYVVALCFFMTMFFNNDGSILITTPIIIQIVNQLHIKPHQKLPYLIGGALIATAASAPIGVSNLANLIALKIVGLDLNTYATLMFVPSMIGIFSIALLIAGHFENVIPKHVPAQLHLEPKPKGHPPHKGPGRPQEIDGWMFRSCISIVVLTRASFFALSGFGIPIESIALIGALLLVLIRWYKKGTGIYDIITQTPWHILIFAFSMYVIVYGLHNSGFTTVGIKAIGKYVADNHFNAIFIIGLLLTVISNLFNNLPSVMVGTLSITNMGLDQHTLQVAYLANIIGSDIGALITPMGTLASLIWIYILRQHKIPITWGTYLNVTLKVIPIGLLTSLFSLYLWTEWLL